LSPRETPRGVQIATHLAKSTGHENVRHYPLAFFEWKDDCEPSKLNKKSRFGSLWIWTITILNMAKKDSSEAKFPIAIGYSKDGHNNLERIIGNDIKRMSEHRALTFVRSQDGSMIEEVAFSAQIFLTIGNQPERRGGNSLLGGKSQSHRRWRYACNFSSLVSIVPACKDCYAFMLDCDSKSRSIAVQWKRECSVCCYWMSKGIDNPMRRYKPGEDFPKG
jgi:hypothetical protein